MEKVKITTEITRDAFGMIAQIADTEITDEVWDKLTEKPIAVNLKDIDDKQAELAVVMVLAGLASKKIEE